MPRSRSRVIARPVIITIVMVRITPIRPGTMLYCVIALGVVERVHAHLEWRRRRRASGASGPLRSFARDRRRELAHRRDRACPVAAGSVASASISSAGRSPRSSLREKSAGMLSTNCTSPLRERGARRVLVWQLADDVEIAARLHRRDVAARELAAGRRSITRGRQVLRIGVDRVAEQHQLHDRNADDHAEGDAVAPQLQELLEHDAPPARERERAFMARASRSCRLRAAHQVDEHVLEARLSARSMRDGRAGGRAAQRRLERGAVACRSRAAPSRRRRSARRPARRCELRGELRRGRRRCTDHVDEALRRDDLARPCPAPAAGRRRCRRACGSARLRPCNAC